MRPSAEVSGGDWAESPGERSSTSQRSAGDLRVKPHRDPCAREAWASSPEFCGVPERSMLEMPEQPPGPPGDAPPSSGVPSVSPNLPLDTVAVIGLGYIGLPTAAVLAQAGKTVIGVDVSQATVDAINAGTVPFVEEGLETVVAGTVAQGKLSAQTGTPEADAYIVSVPTPFKGDHDADLSYIEAAAQGIAPQLSGGELVVLESTAPPGATEFMAEVILGLRPELTMEPNLPNSLYF